DNQTLCFKPDSIKVNNTIGTELNLKAICSRAVAKGYEEFYFPLVEGNRLRCVTNCTSDVAGAIDCNQGQCFLEKSGPACRCFSTDTLWFSGPRCEVAVHWRALVGGLAGAGALLLLVLLGVLSFWVMQFRRKDAGEVLGRSRADDREWFEVWDDDAKGTFFNKGFEDDRTAKDANFQVALQTVDPNVQVHIQRPEMALSSM
uniref:Uncharacterized protein n=1 Tax=Chinchilla lanigera TaxID=34839 RepID=A0A8C2UR33_CHILA